MVITVILGSNSGNKAEYIRQATHLLIQQTGTLASRSMSMVREA